MTKTKEGSSQMAKTKEGSSQMPKTRDGKSTPPRNNLFDLQKTRYLKIMLNTVRISNGLKKLE
jgi:hypothetical protein